MTGPRQKIGHSNPSTSAVAEAVMAGPWLFARQTTPRAGCHLDDAAVNLPDPVQREGDLSVTAAIATPWTLAAIS
jgi:hypothetical protein